MALPTEHQATAPSGTESKRHHQHKQRHFALIVFGAVVCGMIIGAFFPTAKIPASTTENTAVADGSSVVGSKLFDRQTPELAKKLENGKAQSGKKTTGSLVIALDPGHGGIDPGSKAHNGLIEKYLTLDLARRVQLFLSEVDGLEVVLTRTNDLGMSRQERVDRIQEVGADIVVSLHFNHLPQNEVNLVETFIANRENVLESLLKLEQPTGALDLSFTDQSRQLADILHNKVYTEVARRSENVIDAGVKRDTLFVLTRSFTPGALLELTCISNHEEAERLATDTYRIELAASIADGIRDYLISEHSDRFQHLLAVL